MTLSPKTSRTKSVFVLPALAFAVLATPLMAPVDLPLFGVEQAFAGHKASHGSQNGNGNSGGNSNSNRNSASNGNSSNNGNSNGNGGQEKVAGQGNGNLHAQLGGLNSLNRNINGLMNSSDPRMDGVREFVLAGAALSDAQMDLANAESLYLSAVSAYSGLVNSLGISTYADTSPAGLAAELALLDELLLDPVNVDLLAERDALALALGEINASQELQDLINTYGELMTVQGTVDGLLEDTSDDSLLAALQAAANPNRSVNQDVFDWAKLQIVDATNTYIAAQ